MSHVPMIIMLHIETSTIEHDITWHVSCVQRPGPGEGPEATWSLMLIPRRNAGITPV